VAENLSAEQIAAIKAENSRNHRAAQTTRNLVWALVATLLVVLFLVLVVVRPDPATVDPIDFPAAAAQAQAGVDETISSPVLPPGWSSNKAELTTDGEIDVWYIGLITPGEQFIALNQGINANSTWVQNLLDKKKTTGSVQLDGIEWQVYDHRDSDDPGNLAYALVTEVGNSTYVLNGTASDQEFETLALAMGLTNE
jgi:hypothetical protein